MTTPLSANFFNNINDITTTTVTNSSSTKNLKYPSWYSPETGIYKSKHPSRTLPTDTFLDVVSFIFSHPHNGSTALIDFSSGFSIPYSKLLSSIKSLAFQLHHHFGLSKGDVVLVLLPNSVFYPLVLLSVMYLGGVVVPMNPLSTVEEIVSRDKDCKFSFGFCGVDKVCQLKALGLRGVVGVPESLSSDVKSNDFEVIDFLKVFSCESQLDHMPLIWQDDTAAIMYSSGTTGTSKGVVLSHRNFIAMIELFVRFEASQYDGSGSDNVYLSVLPMFHIYGLSLFAMGLLSLGTCIIIMKKFTMGDVLKAIDKYSVTHFPVVPPILTALTKAANSGGNKYLRSLVQVSSGAAPSSPKVMDEFAQSLPHVDFIQGYGMTETTAVGTRGLNIGNSKNYSSIGLLAPDMQAKVVDWNTGSFLPPGSVGELWLRGPGIMKGYLNNAEATLSTIVKGGWLRTGDIVYFDQDGFLYVTDRLKEIIKYKGFQVAPADLEALLTRHPDIVDAGVTAAMEKEVGEIPVAFVVKKNESFLSEAEVIDFVAKQVAPYKKVRKVVFTHSIPRNPAGKILRRELRKILHSKL